MHKILSSTILSLALAQGAYAQYPDQQQDQGGYPDQGYPDQGQDQGTQDQGTQDQADQGAPAQQPQQPPQEEWVEPVDDPVAEPAQSSGPGSFRLLFTFDPGFGGGGTVDVDGFGSGDFDLDPTLGARVQGQIPISDLLFIGLNFGVDGYVGEGAPSDADRLIVLGIGFVFGFQYAISLGSITLEPTGGLAIDFAIGTADDVALDDSAFGFGIGFRAGANIWFTEMFGAQVNLGVQAHQLFDDPLRVGLVQFRLGVGGILRFGA